MWGASDSSGFEGGQHQPANLMEMWLAHVEQANLEHALAESMRQYEVDSEKQKKGINPRHLEVVCLDLEDIENNKECAICFEVQNCGDLAIRLVCGHCFHQKCCIPWFKKNTTCPVCRLEVDPSADSAKMSEQEVSEREKHQQKLQQKRQEKAERLQEQILRMQKLEEENRSTSARATSLPSVKNPDPATQKDSGKNNRMDNAGTDGLEELQAKIQGLPVKQLLRLTKALGLEDESKDVIERAELVGLLEKAMSKDYLSTLSQEVLGTRLQALSASVNNALAQAELVEKVLSETRSAVAQLLEKSEV